MTVQSAQRQVENLSPTEFRQALACYPTGVTVVTARDSEGQPVGMTANSFASVSLAPPLILWSVRREALGFAVYQRARFFGVNVLSEEQSAISTHFAKAGADKFAGVDLVDGAGGAPMIVDAAAQFECRTWDQCDGGDHLIIIGEVLACRRWLRTPLVFAKGRYARLESEDAGLAEPDWPISLF